MYLAVKHVGETPLQCVERTRKHRGSPATYAGRLDPMASGLLLVLEGDECKEAHRYHKLPKRYRYSFVAGVRTDTYDCLGRIREVRACGGDCGERALRNAIRELTGTVTLPYPPYSSKRVGGKALFEHARSGTLGGIDIPSTTVAVHEHILESVGTIPAHELKESAVRTIRRVRGDFRQDECVADWMRVPAQGAFPHITVSVSAEAGVYVRALVNEIGNLLGCPTVTVSIHRTGIGDWQERDAVA